MRTFQHTTPAQFLSQVRLSIGVAEIAIHAEDRPDITLTLAPVDPADTIAADLIERAESDAHDDVFSVTVPRPTASTHGGNRGGQTTVIRSHGSIHVSSSTVRNVIGGSMTGVTIVNGQVIAGPGVTVVGGEVGGLIRAELRVPVGANVEVRAEVADTTTHGVLGRLEHQTDAGELTAGTVAELRAKSISGDITADAALEAFANTTSGDIKIGSTGYASLATVSGDLRVRAASGNVQCRAVSGDVKVHAVANAEVAASTVSGDVKVTHTPGVTVRSRLDSVSGRVRGPKAVDK
jgi:hypothetical protein